MAARVGDATAGVTIGGAGPNVPDSLPGGQYERAAWRSTRTEPCLYQAAGTRCLPGIRPRAIL